MTSDQEDKFRTVCARISKEELTEAAIEAFDKLINAEALLMSIRQSIGGSVLYEE